MTLSRLFGRRDFVIGITTTHPRQKVFHGKLVLLRYRRQADGNMVRKLER